jgi:excisionase family DNA binding protein
MSELLTISQVAKRLGVSVDTVRAWTRQKKLRFVRTEGKHRRFDLCDVVQLQAKLDASAGNERIPPEAPKAPAPRRVAPAPARPLIAGLMREPYWPTRMRDEKARAEAIKAREEARRITEARQAEIADAERREKEVRKQQERDRRLEAFREFGRSRAVQAGLPPEWRSKVTRDLQSYVSEERFPSALADHEGRAYVAARVDAIVTRFREQQSSELAKTLRQLELEHERSELNELVEWGKREAHSCTIGWHQDDRARFERDVARELRDRVAPGWTQADARDVIDDVLEQWTDDPDEDEEEDGEYDEESDDGEDDLGEDE